jgi:peptidoglycan/xylan/chitin deacetylase (PgdA/CDA1 family)
MKNLKLTITRFSLFTIPILGFTLHSGCEAATQPPRPEMALESTKSVSAVPEEPESTPVQTPALVADAATILSRREVPILCYHQVRDYRSTDSKTSRVYIVPPANFKQQMQALADSGYNTILPSDLYEYLTTGKALPEKPVMLTFDDSRQDQVTSALPEMKKHGFKGVFFIMTVALNKPGYMTRDQVKYLSDEGHVIGSHTYDHKNVKIYTPDDWVDQVQKPSMQLQTITGKPVEYFAYPFGLWNKEAIAKLKDHDMKAVFQLAEKRDENDPLHSIRRIIVPDWNGTKLIGAMRRSFK